MCESCFDFTNWKWTATAVATFDDGTHHVEDEGICVDTNKDVLSALFTYSTSAGGAIDNKIEQAMVSYNYVLIFLFLNLTKLCV